MIISIHKASLILKELSKHYPESVSLDEISKQTGISKSTCVQMLNTLIHETLAERTKYARYALGAGCFYLTRSGKFDKKNIEICRPVLNWLQGKTGETAIISQIRSGEKYNVDFCIGNYKLQNNNDDISLDSVYSTAAGRVITAHCSFDELCDIIERHSLPTKEQWKDFSNISEFEEELEHIRSKPYISVEREHTIGFAAPLFSNDRIFGAIGLAVKSDNRKSDEEYTKYLLKAAKEINRRLNF